MVSQAAVEGLLLSQVRMPFQGNGRKESTDTPDVQVRRLVQTLLNAILLKSRKKVSLICPMVMENQESGIAQRERPHSILK